MISHNDRASSYHKSTMKEGGEENKDEAKKEEEKKDEEKKEDPKPANNKKRPEPDPEKDYVSVLGICNC